MVGGQAFLDPAMAGGSCLAELHNEQNTARRLCYRWGVAKEQAPKSKHQRTSERASKNVIRVRAFTFEKT